MTKAFREEMRQAVKAHQAKTLLIAYSNVTVRHLVRVARAVLAENPNLMHWAALKEAVQPFIKKEV